jgi:hypothetical protein
MHISWACAGDEVMSTTSKKPSQFVTSVGSRGVVETAIDLSKINKSSSWERTVKESFPEATKWQRAQKKSTRQ